MKIIPLAVAFTLCLSALPAMAKYVKGHSRKSGTHVSSHHATNRDGTTSNNYSHKGNVNPHTGQKGTRNN
ncbi:hypothetical protein [Verminephrobacter aporrectodeae]|uniref:hypothetical protein n=1 Tax=Verminephrobacter aporrectodeae TaxID=1110389 RepID=UPI00111098D4|nr:hypothetical protein [Verminephrobacter aporrectodeae]